MAKGIVSNRGGIVVTAGGTTAYQDEVTGQTGTTITFVVPYTYGASGVLFYRNGLLMDKVNSFTLTGSSNAEEYQEVNNGSNSTQITLNSTNPATSDELFQMVFLEGIQTVGGGGGTTVDINQVSHGFALLEAIYHNGVSWQKAQANDANTLAQYVVTEVADADNFTAASFGKFEITGHGKTPGEFYFLSDLVAGGSTTVDGEVFSCPLFYVEDANNIHCFVYRPSFKPEPVQFREDVDVLENILSFDVSDGLTFVQTPSEEFFRLTHDASLTKYAEKDLIIGSKFKDKLLQLGIDLTSTAANGNFKVIITDLTNSKTLANEVLSKQDTTTTVKRVVTFSTKPILGDDPIGSIRVRLEALPESGAPETDFGDVVVSLAKTQAIDLEVIEQEENVFSARIANNGTATITSQSSPFIDSVSRTSLGRVQVNFKSGFFSTTPSIQVSHENSSGEVFIDNEAPTGFRLVSQNAGGTVDIDSDFTFTATRQGSDYRNLTRRVEREISTFKEVIVEEPDSMVRLNTGNGFGGTNIYVRRFANLEKSLGSDILYEDSASLGSSFTIQNSGIYSISYTEQANSTGNFGITKNSTDYPNGGLTVDQRLAMQSFDTTDGDYGSVNWSGYLEEGDVIRATVLNGNSASTRASFTIARQGSLKKATVAPDSKIDIPTSELRFENATALGAVDTRIVRFTTLSKIRGDAFTVTSNANNGTVIQINKAGKLDINCSLYFASAGEFDITRNQSTLTGSPLTSESLACEYVNASHVGSASWSGFVEVGDLIRISSNITPTTENSTSLNLFHQEQKIQVAVSNVTPQYQDVDSMVRLQGGNGAGSTNTAIRRFSNVLENLGSDITYTDSATEGAKFVINEDGNYEISYSEQHGAAAAVYFGITKNSTELTTGINALATPSSRLSIQTATGTSGLDFQSTSWSGFLSAGDVIRPHVGNTGAPNGVLIPTFTIAKVGVPSIAEVDVTPFADVNRVVRESIHAHTHAGFGSTNTKIPYFSQIVKSSINELGVISNSISQGFSFTASQRCKVTVSFGMDSNGASSNYVGLSLNSTQLTTDVQLINSTDRLSLDVGAGGDPCCASASVILEEGDVLRPHTQGLAPNSTNYTFFTLTAEADSRTTMYSVAQTENEFSARISNNGTTAAIVSESSSFIASVTRVSTGLVDVTFNPSFFTVIPSVLANPNLALSPATTSSAEVRNLTSSGCRIAMYDIVGSLKDYDFSLSVSRQGADRQDLQKAIVQLNEFPRVNKVISQQINHNSSGSTLLDRNGEVRFDTANLISSGSSILAIEDDSGNSRTKFTALKDCRVTVTFNGRITSAGGFQVDVYKNNSLVQRGNNSDGAGSSAFVSYTATILKGDYITLATNGDSIENSAELCQLNILAEAEDLEVITNVDAHENVFSARITSAGAITTKNYDWIDSITKGAAGIYTINLKAGFFSVAPAVEGIVETNSDSTFTAVPTTTSIVIEINSGGVKTDRDFSIFVQRQGDDYKSIQDVVAQVFTPKTAVLTEIDNVGTSFVASSWNTFPFNTQEGDDGVVQLSADQLIFQPGKYILNGGTNLYSGANAVVKANFRLYNVTTSSVHTTKVGTFISYPISAGFGGAPGYLKFSPIVLEVNVPTTFRYEIQADGSMQNGANSGPVAGIDYLRSHLEITKVY